MIHVFIGLSIIMFLARISILLGILMHIMLVLGGFWRLKRGNSLSKTDYESQENHYSAPFIIYLYNFVNHQFMLKKYPHHYQHHHTLSDLSLNTYV